MGLSYHNRRHLEDLVHILQRQGHIPQGGLIGQLFGTLREEKSHEWRLPTATLAGAATAPRTPLLLLAPNLRGPVQHPGLRILSSWKHGSRPPRVQRAVWAQAPPHPTAPSVVALLSQRLLGRLQMTVLTGSAPRRASQKPGEVWVCWQRKGLLDAGGLMRPGQATSRATSLPADTAVAS